MKATHHTYEAGKSNVADKLAGILLMLSFVLPMRLQVFTTMGTGLYFIFRTVQLRYKPVRANILWSVLLGSTFLFFMAALPFAAPEYTRAVKKACEHRVSLLFMPVLFAVMAPGLRQTIAKQYMYFVYGTFVACLVGNVNYIYHYLAGSGALSHVAYRASMHMLLDIHPTYLSMYLCLSICIMLLVPRLQLKVNALVLNVLLYVSFLFLLALGAKTPILAMFVILLHFAWVQRGELKRYRMVFFGLVVTALLAWAFVPFIGQRIAEMTEVFGEQEQAGVVDNSVAARKAIWHMDVALVKSHWLTGVGAGRITDALMQASADNGLPIIYEDPHNEYVYQWLYFGVAGLLLLLALMGVHLWYALRVKDLLYLYLALIFIAVFFTESVLALQRGIMLYAVFTSLLFFEARRKSIISPA